MRRFRPLSLQSHVFILISIVLLLAFGLASMIIRDTLGPQLEERIGIQSLNIARAVARQDVVKEYLGKPGGAEHIQPAMEDIRKSTGALFIVVIDMNGIRYSHPVFERIGLHVVGGDEGPALSGHEYVSTARGTLGVSQRGFAPIYADNGKQIGAVLVGFSTEDVKGQVDAVLGQVNLALGAGIIIAMIGSFFAAERIKKTMFNMEPSEIAAFLKERDAILSSVHEGLLAVDKSGRVTLINDEAQRIMKCGPDIVGRHVDEVIPNTRLPLIIQSGIPEVDREQVIYDAVIVTTRVPVKVGNQVIGAVASFRDKTEVKELAEQLTGVRRYAEALRTQTHEFRNKLHTIAGFIQLGDYEKALSCIMEAVDPEQGLFSFLNSRVKPAPITALLLGKGGRARELGIKFQVLPGSQVGELPERIDQDSIGTILGNLVDNAFEAVLGLPKDKRRVQVYMKSSENDLEMTVEDSGPGIPKEIRRRIFESGFSTKRPGRGIGLSLVSQLVANAKGTLLVGDSPLGGALFTVRIPYKDLPRR